MNKLLKKNNKETIKIISHHPANLLQPFNPMEVIEKKCKLSMKKRRTVIIYKIIKIKKRMNMIQKKNDNMKNIETI